MRHGQWLPILGLILSSSGCVVEPHFSGEGASCVPAADTDPCRERFGEAFECHSEGFCVLRSVPDGGEGGDGGAGMTLEIVAPVLAEGVRWAKGDYEVGIVVGGGPAASVSCGAGGAVIPAAFVGTTWTCGITTAVEPGTQETEQVVVAAIDAAGTKVETTVEIVVDRIPPALAFQSPAPGRWPGSPGAAMNVTVAVEEANLGQVTISAEGGSGGLLPTTCAAAVCTLSFEPDTADVGAYRFTAVAVDKAGNEKQAALELFIDAQPPTLEFAAEQPVLMRDGELHSIAVTITDDDPRVAPTAQAYLVGAGWNGSDLPLHLRAAPTEANPNRWALAVDPSRPDLYLPGTRGKATFEVTAVDDWGNATSRSGELEIHRDHPMVDAQIELLPNVHALAASPLEGIYFARSGAESYELCRLVGGQVESVYFALGTLAAGPVVATAGDRELLAFLTGTGTNTRLKVIEVGSLAPFIISEEFVPLGLPAVNTNGDLYLAASWLLTAGETKHGFVRLQLSPNDPPVLGATRTPLATGGGATDLAWVGEVSLALLPGDGVPPIVAASGRDGQVWLLNPACAGCGVVEPVRWPSSDERVGPLSASQNHFSVPLALGGAITMVAYTWGGSAERSVAVPGLTTGLLHDGESLAVAGTNTGLAAFNTATGMPIPPPAGMPTEPVVSALLGAGTNQSRAYGVIEVGGGRCRVRAWRLDRGVYWTYPDVAPDDTGWVADPFACPLPGAEPILVGRRLYVPDGEGKIHQVVIDLPGLATRGWPLAGGNAQRQSRAP